MTWLLSHLYGVVYWSAIGGGLVWWARSTRRPQVARATPRTPAEEAELARLKSRLLHLRSEGDRAGR